MTKIITFLFILFITLSCSQNDTKTINWKLSIFESYDLIELYPMLLEANSQIRKIQLDSIQKQNTGTSLLDELNKQKEGKDTVINNTIEDYPLFQILTPNVQLDNKGQAYIGSTSIIGMTQDTITLKKYFAYVDSLFPTNLEWKVSGKLHNNIKCLHAIKSKGIKSSLAISDIDSVIVTPTGLTGLLSLTGKIDDLKGFSSFWIAIKLKADLNDTFGNKTYSIIIKSGNYEYSGSVIDFKNNPNQLITIGEMDKDDFMYLKNIFKDRMKIIK